MWLFAAIVQRYAALAARQGISALSKPGFGKGPIGLEGLLRRKPPTSAQFLPGSFEQKGCTPTCDRAILTHKSNSHWPILPRQHPAVWSNAPFVLRWRCLGDAALVVCSLPLLQQPSTFAVPRAARKNQISPPNSLTNGYKSSCS